MEDGAERNRVLYGQSTLHSVASLQGCAASAYVHDPCTDDQAVPWGLEGFRSACLHGDQSRLQRFAPRVA